MNKSQALYTFWSSFGWAAYDESSVPDNADKTVGRYITYEDSEADLGDPVLLTASLWMRAERWDIIAQKALEISQSIGWGGIYVPLDEGFLWIKRGRPFSTRMRDTDDSIRRIVLSVEVDFISN